MQNKPQSKQHNKQSKATQQANKATAINANTQRIQKKQPTNHPGVIIF